VKEEKDKLRDFMKEALYDYEVAPDPKDWNRIAKTLHKGNGRRSILWVILPLAASLLILIALYTGGILSHSDNTSGQIAINHTPQDKQSVRSTVNKKLSAEDALQNGSTKKQLSGNNLSENIQPNKRKTVISSNIEEGKNINSSKTGNEKTLTQSGQLNTIKSAKGLIQKAKTSESKNNLLANNPIKQTKRELSSAKTVNIANTQSVASLNSNQNGNLQVHSLIPISSAVILNNTAKLNYNQFDLKQYFYEGTLSGNAGGDLMASNATTIKFKGLSLSNSSGMQMQASSEKLSYSGAFASQLTSSMYLNSVKVLDNTLKTSPNIGDLFQNKKRNYSPPLTFGLNINLSLPGNWSIETGIQYTNLQSKGEVTIGSTNEVQFVTNNKYSVDESLHYIGIPFNLNYTFYNRRKTTIYISTGFSIEKGIDAKYKAVSVDNIPGLLPIYSHNSIKGLQSSVNSGIGISYKFIPHFELFTQPSITYYIDSQNNSTTIYSVHPWLFNLRSGIRYTLK
jgi:hypothetical protein